MRVHSYRVRQRERERKKREREKETSGYVRHTLKGRVNDFFLWVLASGVRKPCGGGTLQRIPRRDMGTEGVQRENKKKHVYIYIYERM